MYYCATLLLVIDMSRDFISKYEDGKILYNHIIMQEKNIEFDVHAHDICEMIFIKKGNVLAVIGAKTYKLRKGSLIIFRPHIPHRIIVEGDDYERYDIIFDEKQLANKMFDKIPQNTDVIDCSGSGIIEDLLKKIDYYYMNFEGKNIKLLVTNIIEEIVLNLTLIAKEGTDDGLISVNPTINRAVEYIDEFYTEDITIEDICKRLYITKSHLHHLFTSHLQISPKKYVNFKRLAKARNLIRMGTKPTEVYLSCGFTDYVTFFRNYKNQFGHSPKDELNTEIQRRIES